MLYEKLAATFKSVFNWRSKTFAGVAILFLGVLLNSIGFYPDVPIGVTRIAGVIAAALVFFGWYDAVQNRFETLAASFRDWVASSPGVGFVINAVFYLFDNFVEIGDSLPAWAKVLIYSTGAFLMAMGMRNAGAVARHSAEPIHLGARLKDREALKLAGYELNPACENSALVKVKS